MPTVQGDTMIHESTLNRWMREMPIAVQTFTEEWEAEQTAKVLAEGGPSVEELVAERERPVPAKEPPAPFERRPFDPDRVRRNQADWA